MLPETMRILLADDDPDTLLVLTDRLESFGYRVAAVSNGREAVEEIKQTDYAAVVMDIKMPEMDGLEALRAMKQARPNMPVIMITSVKEKMGVALIEGAESCLLKPVDPDRLRAVLDRSIGKTR
jgi:CheY-like chemotaxis protein